MAPGQPQPITDDNEYLAMVKKVIARRKPKHPNDSLPGIHDDCYEMLERLVDIIERRRKLAPWLDNPQVRFDLLTIKGIEGYISESNPTGVIIITDDPPMSVCKRYGEFEYITQEPA